MSEAQVRADFPSARPVKTGLFFVAIRAIERDPQTRKIVRDHHLGSGKTEAAAWADAAGKLDCDRP